MKSLRFAFRQLRKTPGFTILATVTLGLGVGLNTTIFSVVNDLFLRRLPFSKPDRIVRIYGELAARNLRQLPFSIPRFWHYRDSQSAFSAMAADNGAPITLTGLGTAVQLNASAVTANYFDLLGVRPVRGRLFRQEEESTAAVVLVSESFWRGRLGGDPNVLGRSVTLNGVPRTIIGVLPNMPVAWFGPDLEVWIPKPFELDGYPRERLMRGAGYLRVVARLKPGVSEEQARASLSSLDQSYRVQNGDKNDSTWTTTLLRAPDDLTSNLRPACITLLIAVGFVLLIACGNVANLLLVRFSGRRREIALRMALGASRRAVVGLFVTESTLVSLAGGVLGGAAAVVLIPLIPKIAPNNLPLEAHVALNWPMLFFTLAVSLLTGFAMGLYPALQSSDIDLAHGLKEGGRAMTGGARQQRFRRILVGAQVALSVALLSGALLLIASFIRLSHQDTGFRSEGLCVGFLQLPAAPYPDPATRVRFADRFLADLRRLPGVQGASVSESVPLNGNGRSSYARADQEAPPPSQRPVAPLHNISSGYFAAMGIPLRSGRDFNEGDTLDHPLVAVISESLAQHLYQGENPLGRPLYVGNNNGIGDRVEIVGVVGDVRTFQIAVANAADIYRPWTQDNKAFVAFAVRSNLNASEVAKLVQAEVQAMDPSLAVFQAQPMQQIIDASLGQPHLLTLVLGLFAGVALLLATVGIYGSVAFTVVQRTGEIGVRMALGAQTRDVLRLVLSQGMTPVIAGLVAGLALSFADGHLLATQLYEVSPQNPWLLSATALTLAFAGVVACAIPAARAISVSPMEALRAE